MFHHLTLKCRTSRGRLSCVIMSTSQLKTHGRKNFEQNEKSGGSLFSLEEGVYFAWKNWTESLASVGSISLVIPKNFHHWINQCGNLSELKFLKYSNHEWLLFWF